MSEPTSILSITSPLLPSKPNPRARIFTALDVSVHASPSSCWLSRGGKVYDVTGFLHDHPGGDDLILPYGGRDMGDAMADMSPEGHEHSDSAYEMLEGMCIGRLGSEAAVVSEDWIPEEDFHPEDTKLEEDFAKSEFLDLRKALLPQLWCSNFSKSFYLQQVHQPRHVSQSAKLFGPDFLEVFTLTPWYIVPMLWVPITAYLFLLSSQQFSPSAPYPIHTSPILVPLPPLLKTALCFLLGNLVWTILEYIMHRFVFHVDSFLPDNPKALVLHFLLHGVHHYLPMDRLRLVMPPALFAMLSFPFTRLAYVLFPRAMANGVIAGSFAFYVIYDVMHYALHHTKLPAHLREMKRYHLAHHYKNFELGFGVTSKIWDYVFGTVLRV